MSPALSSRSAKRALCALQYVGGPENAEAIAELERALHPKRIRPVSKKRAAKRDETAEIRYQVFNRARGFCECTGSCALPADELDHFFGRGKAPQSVRNCWALSHRCHADKTRNRPDAVSWLRHFIAHCERYGYLAEAERARARIQSLEQKGLATPTTGNTKEG